MAYSHVTLPLAALPQRYGQMSYYEALLQPVARAVASANYRKAIVYFSLQVISTASAELLWC